MADKKTGLFHEIFKPTLVLFLICLIVAAALASTNYITKGKIDQQEKAEIDNAMAVLLPEMEFREVKENAYKASKDGETAGYVFVTVAKGYGGNVKVMTAVDLEGVVTGVTVVSADDETPGLGQKAKDETGAGKQLKDSFKGKSGSVDIKDVDAMTGATITSTAVTKAVDEALQMYKELGGAK